MNQNTTRRFTSILMGLGIVGFAFAAQAATPENGAKGHRGRGLATQAQGERRTPEARQNNKAARAAKWAERAAQLDTNKDGQLQVSEVLEHRQAKMKARLQKADANRDGILQDSERKAVRKGHKGERGEDGARIKAHKKGRRGKRTARS